MDGPTVATSIGSAVGAVALVLRYFPPQWRRSSGDQHFSDRQREQMRATMTEVLKEEFGPVMERQTELLDI
jgi:hypothetical protein